MSFFYDLNKKLDSIRATPEVTHQQLNERNMSQHAKGIEKYTKPGMEKLSKLGREGASKAKMDATRKEFDQYDNEEVKEESGEWSKIPVGVIDGPGGYDGAQQRIKDYESGNINRDGKKLPPVVDRSRPADKPTVYNKSDSEEYSNPPEWKGGYRPPVVDKSRPAKSIDEGPLGFGKKIYNVGKQAADEIGDYYSRNPKTGELNTLPDRDMRPGETFDTAWERMQDTRAMQQGRGEIKRGKYGGMHVDPKTGAYVPQPIVYIKADEGLAGAGKKIYDLGKRAASGINKMIGHGSDEEMLGKLKKDVGVIHPTGDKRPTPPGMQSTAKPQNFADKIANAKKEVDEMLGDVAAEAMRSALSPKQKKMAALGGDPKRIDARDLAALRKGADMGEERSKGTAFDMSTPRAAKPKVGSVERGHKHEIKHTATGRMVTRRVDDQGNSVGADDDSAASGEKRGRGRPKGTKGAIGAKGPSGKSKLMTKEGEVDIRDQGEYDQEGDMAKDDIKTIVRHAQALSTVLGDNDNLPEWVQSKLAKIEGMMISIDEYMQNQEGDDEEEPIAEKAVSKKQQRFMGMVHSAQQGKKPASKAVGKVANTMKKSDAEDFAKTKHKGLPEKAKKKEVDETSEEGRITTTRTGPGKTLTTSSTGRVSATIGNGKMSVKPGKPEKQMDDDTDTASVSNKDTSPSKSNSMVGKGIYDSMNRDLELMIAESMTINMSDSTEGGKSLTITATDEDAMKLAMILKSAGLGSGDVQEAVDDNAPDYPTNTEQADNNFGYAGGLNKPKTDVAGDGQSTVPVTAVHTQEEDALRRMMEMAGLAEAAKPDFLDLDKDGKKNEPMKDAADDVNEEEDTVEESMHRMREAAGIKIKNNLGPTSPDIARMSKDEVDAALRSGMNSKVDLGPTSPDIARMSKDEVDAALRSGMSPDISNMDPDSVNAEFNKEDRQYEDSMQRMREMAGIKEAKKQVDQNNDGKNDFEDIKIARMKASGAIKDKEEKKVDESIFALTNQWQAYKG